MKAFSRFLIVLGTVVLAATSVNAQKPIDLSLIHISEPTRLID